MKANELMVDDWVRYENTHQRIGQISGYDNEVFLEETELVNAVELKPIPLTFEILKKNGFDFCSNGWIVWTSTDDKEVAWLYNCLSIITRTAESIHLTNCCFVHQLQHALRLCGLDELADNFKV